MARTLFPATTLARAFARLGFVQADPIRAPARAQDLILRHRVRGYRNGDLEAGYDRLPVEEDFFVNYGFVTRDLQALMHPRDRGVRRTPAQRRRSAELLAFVNEHGTVHPRDVDRHFAHGTVTNYWGGASSATTHLLDDMHYRGLLRVARRAGGIRLYAAREAPDRDTTIAAETSVRRPDAREAAGRMDSLVDAAVHLYAPVPQATLAWLTRRLELAAPQWRRLVPGALARAKRRLGHGRAAGMSWYWPAGEDPTAVGSRPRGPRLRLLAPFDPLVWDRRRFELLWGWAYRFEAYTPRPKRRLGYYALPLLWDEAVVGWANLSVQEDVLHASLGFAAPRPRGHDFDAALEAEIDAVRSFLGVGRARLDAPAVP